MIFIKPKTKKYLLMLFSKLQTSWILLLAGRLKNIKNFGFNLDIGGIEAGHANQRWLAPSLDRQRARCL